MREADSVDIRKQYARERTMRSVYGMFISAVGTALLIWLPAREWLRVSVGFLIILLGGVMISPQAVKDWFSLFGDFLPFGRKADK
jgi:hypothetical protein